MSAPVLLCVKCETRPVRPRTGRTGAKPTMCLECTVKNPSRLRSQRRNRAVERQVERIDAVERGEDVAPIPQHERPPRAKPKAAPAPAPNVEDPADPKTEREHQLKAQIRDGYRGLDLLRNGPGPWRCASCGPLTQREEPLHGSDERMHCPRCDGPCTTGVGGELPKVEGSPWEHPGKRAARIAARGGNAP